MRIYRPRGGLQGIAIGIHLLHPPAQKYCCESPIMSVSKTKVGSAGDRIDMELTTVVTMHKKLVPSIALPPVQAKGRIGSLLTLKILSILLPTTDRVALL